ncbi:hypothetical protein Poli38472_005692 [Pythium oligandrum]|uniref:AB hydrolase-1 domain-containing protein n=1 Tax=Pythium oligandrum TaxID=41045 RepID=A0A8K1FJF6_PYTOL|nr:hypothetical protein Poli38472_005692 [Pythium oligandrum]|eukprot:TMW63074.1 hypothetical protein Poli38472_005692 [Pythium oligandrum]
MSRRLCILLAAALALTPISSGAVEINGWYQCSASTLWDAPDEPDMNYYMETKRRRAAPSAHYPQAKTNGDAPKFVLSEKRQWRIPFLQQSMEFSKSQSAHSRRRFKDGKEAAPVYECAEFRVPLCYEGICNSTSFIDVFVKRVLPMNSLSEGESKKALWVLQGGPGASSTAMEDLLETMHTELDGKVAIYTMDHRGTARSNRLECQAAQAQTPGSPGGTVITVEEVPACIDDILFQIENQTAAFSVTSAAMDLRTIIEQSSDEDEDVYVYGLSYGTYLVERLIHFAPKRVRGYVIDGIVSEAGAKIEDRSTYSNWDHDVGVVAERFLGYCAADSYCKSKFPETDNLATFVKDLYQELDEAAQDPGQNECADVLQAAGRRPSYFLRSLFGDYLMSQTWRIVIPAIIFRAARCSSEDVDALQHLVDDLSGPPNDNVDVDDLLFTSEPLYNLIVFSEMWETPTPSKTTLMEWYENATMASDNYYSLPYYCLFTGSREEACKELKHLPPSQPMMYERDQYWNVTAKLPVGSSALLMSGGLDVQTRRMYGNLEYELLEGDHMLVHFDYAGHCTTFTTLTRSGVATCGVQILASYVREDGVLLNVDTSCIDDTFALDFHGDSRLAEELFGRRNLYE